MLALLGFFIPEVSTVIEALYFKLQIVLRMPTCIKGILAIPGRVEGGSQVSFPEEDIDKPATAPSTVCSQVTQRPARMVSNMPVISFKMRLVSATQNVTAYGITDNHYKTTQYRKPQLIWRN